MDFCNKEYEQVLLGMMINDNSVIELVQGKVSKEYFFYDIHGKIFSTICSQFVRDGGCTMLSLTSELSKVDPILISEISGSSFTSANWEYYADEIKKFWTARTLRKTLAEKLEDLTPISVEETMHALDTSLTSLMTNGASGCHDTQSLIGQLLENIQKSAENKTPYLGTHTGWDNFSEIIDGVQHGKLYVIGARPSIGKTAFAVQMASQLCEQGESVCIFSLEMTGVSLMTRMSSLKSGIPLNFLKHAMQPTTSFYTKLNNALSQIYDYKLNIYDSRLTNEKDLFARIRIEAKTKGTKVFFVDHLGLVPSSNPAKKKVEHLDEVTQRLLQLAQELDVAIVCLCQLKRDSEGKRPNLSDLRDSGAIEQNADVCIFLHRERAKGNEESIDTEVIVIKNRDGECGTAYMKFYPAKARFEEAKEPHNDSTRCA